MQRNIYKLLISSGLAGRLIIRFRWTEHNKTQHISPTGVGSYRLALFLVFHTRFFTFSARCAWTHKCRGRRMRWSDPSRLCVRCLLMGGAHYCTHRHSGATRTKFRKYLMIVKDDLRGHRSPDARHRHNQRDLDAGLRRHDARRHRRRETTPTVLI